MDVYRIEQFVKKISVPIVCRFDGADHNFENGETLAAYQFKKRYMVDNISLENGNILIILKETNLKNINYYVEDETVSDDEWIKEHIERFNSQPNLFDGT